MAVNGDQIANAAAGAATTAAAAWLSAAGDIVTHLLGVPLPVVIASIAGAFLARVYLPPLAFAAALVRSGIWVIVGCVLSQGISAAASLQVGWLGMLALAVSGLGPKLWPVLVEMAPELLQAGIARFTKKGSNEEGKP